MVVPGKSRPSGSGTRILEFGPGLKAARQSELDEKSSGYFLVKNVTENRIPTFRDENLAQSQDGLAVPLFNETGILISPGTVPLSQDIIRPMNEWCSRDSCGITVLGTEPGKREIGKNPGLSRPMTISALT